MKSFLLLAVSFLFVLSCGTPKVASDTKEATTEAATKVIIGDWGLNSIKYSDGGDFLISIFNDTSKECFKGSNWNFVPSENSGSYTINKNDCPNGERTFRFITNEADPSSGFYDFHLKLTGEKHKSDRSASFKMHLLKLTKSAMTWEQTVTIEGMNVAIKMNFSKK